MTMYEKVYIDQIEPEQHHPEEDWFEKSDLCGCDCNCDEDGSCDCDHSAEGEETTIVMTDSDGKEYEFMLYDEIQYNEETYLLLLTRDDEDPELVIVKVVEGEDGNDSLVSVDEEEFDQVFAEYECLCDETQEDEDDDEDDEETQF
jgi:uncharacterized protein YrzB (UPF0473 family)